MESFKRFLVEWFRGPIGGAGGVLEKAAGMLREFGRCVGPMKKCTFYRESVEYSGLLLWIDEIIEGVLSGRNRTGKLRAEQRGLVIKSVNIFMGVGFWVDISKTVPEQGIMLYDRVCYDIDSEENPEKAVDVALTFAKNIEARYGATPIVFLSGFKGAHVVIPLSKSTDWEGYELLWGGLLKALPREYRQFVDRNMLQFNRLDRVPLTWNIKEVDGVVKRAFAKIIYPEEFTWQSFAWSKLQLLDPSKVTVYRVTLPEVPKPKIVKLSSNNNDSVALHGYRWVERVIESGLPDGRHRFILYVLSAYLVNIKNLDIEEAHQVVKKFIENSCRNFNNCSKVYDSFILGDLKRVEEKGLKPASLKTIQGKDPQLYSIIMEILNKSNPTSTNSITTSNIDIESEQLRVPPELQAFLSESGFREFGYGDVKNWIEKCFGSIEASKWHSIERSLRQLAEKCVLGRKFLVDGSWIDYGCGKVEKPPSKDVRFYVVKDLSLLSS
jgi:hypothetical protein